MKQTGIGCENLEQEGDYKTQCQGMTCLKGIHILQAMTFHLEDHCLSVREIYTPHNELKKNLTPTHRPDVINVNTLHSL